MPASLPPDLVARLHRTAKSFRTPDDVKAVARAVIANSRPDRKDTTE